MSLKEDPKRLGTTGRRRIRATGFHSAAYQWLMTCIKGLRMPKIVNEPLSPSISGTRGFCILEECRGRNATREIRARSNRELPR